MKNLFIALSLVFSMVLGAQTNKVVKLDPTAKGAKIKFDKNAHNFGTVYTSQGTVTTDFEFTNVGTDTLKLTNVRTSCGCTSPKWTREGVAPGEKGSITIGYRVSTASSFRKSITVYSNAENAMVTLSISGKQVKGNPPTADAK